jgi:adenosyl cobinamide kinase/adenosyl cobinamide phosphate guanylyltransferase
MLSIKMHKDKRKTEGYTNKKSLHMDQIDKKQKKTERQRKMFVQSLNMYVYFLLQDNANMAG